MEKVSIIIPNFNGWPTIKHTLNSIFNQTYPQKEIIIVDDYSTDKSREYLKSLHNIKLILHHKNRGDAVTRNHGATIAIGDFLFFIDNDILLESPKFIEELIKTYNQLPDIAFLTTAIFDKNKTTTHYIGIYYSTVSGTYLKRKKITRNQLKLLKKPFRIGSPHGGLFLIKRSIWERLTGMDESLKFHLGDIDIGARAYLSGYQNYLTPHLIATHLPSQKTNNEFNSRFQNLIEGHYITILKNFPSLLALFTLLTTSFIFLGLSLKHSLTKHSLSPLISLLKANISFTQKIPTILSKRKTIQTLEIKGKQFTFLQIKPPHIR